MGKLLTPLELKVMNQLWSKKKAFVKELLNDWPEDPKPAYNTISTTVRILQDKGFVQHEAFGRTHQYSPALTKAAYQKIHLKSVVENVFAGSLQSLVSTLIDDGELSSKDKQDIQSLLDQDQV